MLTHASDVFGLGKDVCIAQMIHNSVCSVSSLCTLHGFHFFWTREDEPRCGGRVVGLPWHSLYHAQTVSLCSFYTRMPSVFNIWRVLFAVYENRTAIESWLRQKRRPFTRRAAAVVMSHSDWFHSRIPCYIIDLVKRFILYFLKYNFTRCSLSNVRSEIVALSTHVMYLLKKIVI